MRILSLAPTSFFNDYGCHVRIYEEARALQAAGHRVTVLTYFKGEDVPDLEIEARDLFVRYDGGNDLCAVEHMDRIRRWPRPAYAVAADALQTARMAGGR